MPEEIPYWVTSTHPDHVYKLVLFENNDGGVEDVEMTRAEYIELKAHLAAMRGYTIGDFRARIADLAENGPEGHLDGGAPQMASHLLTARDLYRCCPDLVVHGRDFAQFHCTVGFAPLLPFPWAADQLSGKTSLNLLIP